MHHNLAGFLSGIVTILLSLAGRDAFISMGTSFNGMVLNLSLWTIKTIFFGLGCSVNFDGASIKKPIYCGSIVLALLFFDCWLGFLLFAETLLSGYHVSFDDDRVRHLILNCLQYGWSGQFFQMSAWLVAGMMTTDFMYIYALNRCIAIIEFGMCLVIATNKAWWTTKNEHGVLDNFIGGQWVNLIMFLTFFLLPYVPIIMVDNQIAQNVHEAVAGAPVGKPTLLAGGSQPKSGLKEPFMR